MGPSRTILVLLISMLSRTAVCQQRAPLVSLMAGAGHPFGGIGAQGEVLIADGRLGIIGGAGTFPGLHYLRSSITGSAGVRYYFVRQQHRLYASATWSLLQVYDLEMVGVPTVYQYGPGFTVGYSFLSKVGLTFTVGAGVGRTRHETVPIGALGLGWTWRRSS